MRLIDADALIHRFCAERDAVEIEHAVDIGYHNGLNMAASMTINASTIDAVEVVRCKDCEYCYIDLSGRDAHLCMSKEVGFIVRRKLDDFCSYGERKEQ